MAARNLRFQPVACYSPAAGRSPFPGIRGCREARQEVEELQEILEMLDKNIKDREQKIKELKKRSRYQKSGCRKRKKPLRRRKKTWMSKTAFCGAGPQCLHEGGCHIWKLFWLQRILAI